MNGETDDEYSRALDGETRGIIGLDGASSHYNRERARLGAQFRALIAQFNRENGDDDTSGADRA